jgi:hypothetical protein
MITRHVSLTFLLGLLCTGTSAWANGPDAVAKMIDATFKVVNPKSNATAFLIACPGEDGPDSQRTVLTTAAHVFENMVGDECRIVLREKQDDGTFARKEQNLKIRSDRKPLWKKHADVDVAAMEVTVPATFSAAALPFDQLADAKAIASGDLRTGDKVASLGYPAQLESTPAGFPVLRRGVVASHPLAPVNALKTFLVDCSTFGGDSGGPVFLGQRAAHADNLAKQQPVVVGMVLGQHRQTDKVTLPFEERTTHHPLGLAIVVHSHFIRETIELLPQ